MKLYFCIINDLISKMKNASNRNLSVLKVILIVFAINASSSYGSCFWGDDLSQAQPQAEMPCHQSENISESVDESCCAACVGLQAASDYTIMPLDAAAVVVSLSFSARSTNSPEPRYRPPITHFS